MTKINLSQIETIINSQTESNTDFSGCADHAQKLFSKTDDFVSLPFYKNEKPLESSPSWGMTLRNAGSMRFRWAENNPTRTQMLAKIADSSPEKIKPRTVQVQLDHTKTVVCAENTGDTKYNIADGILTKNNKIMPVITIADCVALYLFDSETRAFGVVHSGWKGTGIVKNAVEKMEKEYGSLRKNISIAVSAHIHSCCYIINEERARYFIDNFGENCVQKLNQNDSSYENEIKKWKNLKGSLYRLSLEQANLNLLKQCEIRSENIVILDECTSCNNVFGSNRRETQEGKTFTVQAAFVLW